MLKLVLIAHIILLISCCRKSIYFPLSECVFEYTEDSNDNINFHNCTIASDGSFNGWESCFKKCCNREQYSSYSSPS